MELTREARLALIEAGHRRWQERERAKLAALFAGNVRASRSAWKDEEGEGDVCGDELLTFDEVCP